MRSAVLLVFTLLGACASDRWKHEIAGPTIIDDGELVFFVERLDRLSSRAPDCAGALVAWEGTDVYVQVFCERPEEVPDFWATVQGFWPEARFVPARERAGSLAICIPFTHVPEDEPISVWRLIGGEFTKVISFHRPVEDRMQAAEAAVKHH